MNTLDHTLPVFDGPTPADLVERALDDHRNLPADQRPAFGAFVVDWLRARGVTVRPLDDDDVPDLVAEAIADVVAPDEIGAHDSTTSNLVHRVMRTAYAATVAHLARQETTL